MNRQWTESEGRGTVPNAVRRKLRSHSGVSILVVLLVFLLCATSGSAILTAATVSAGRVKDRHESDQAYYSVLSAARLFSSQVEGQEVTLTVPRTETWTKGEDGFPEGDPVPDYSGTDGLKISDSNGGEFDISSYTPKKSLLMDAIYKLCGDALKDESGRQKAWEGPDPLLNKSTDNISYWFTMIPESDSGIISGGDYQIHGRVALTPDKDPEDGGTLVAVFSDKEFAEVTESGSTSYQVKEDAFAVAMTVDYTGNVSTETPPDWTEAGDTWTRNSTRTFTFGTAEIGEG